MIGSVIKVNEDNFNKNENNVDSNVNFNTQNIIQNLNDNTSLDEQKNDKKKKKSIFKIIITLICILLTILVIINTIKGLGVMYFFSLLNPITFILALIGLGGVIQLSAFQIAIIWIAYGIISLLYKFYNKLIIKYKKIFIFILIFLILIGFIYFISKKTYDNNHLNLAEVLNEPPSYELYDSTSYYFIHNDKIYYYVLESNNDYTKIYDKFYVMNLDGTGNKKIAETDELRYATFYFVYNNEAYYYTMYYNENKKIDLSTGEITSLGNDDIFISKTLNNGKVNVFIDHAIAGNAYSIFKKIDLNTNKTISEIKTLNSMAGKKYFLDYDSGNVYYLETFYSEYPTLYKNTDVLYQLEDEQKNVNIEFIAVNNDYLYYKSNNYIYKLNIVSKQIEKEIYNNLGTIQRISSGNNIDNYFYQNGKIYQFDLTNDKFVLILSDVKNKPEYVYNINNRLIFTENTDNLKYYSEKDNLGSVIVYNIYNNDTIKFENIRKLSFDENYMYLLISKDEEYVVEKYELTS